MVCCDCKCVLIGIGDCYHSPPHLADSISLEEFRRGVEYIVGIGQIGKLPPYWYVVNYGNYSPPSHGKHVPLGSFGGSPPVAGQAGGMWEVGKGSWTFLDDFIGPKKPITPMNYIETTAMWIASIWPRYWETVF